jgi:hypothetical protein
MASINSIDTDPTDIPIRWLDRPMTNIECLLSWLVSTVVWFVLVGLLGGPTEGDAAESVYSTWSIAHGSLACAYPPGRWNPNEIAAPFALLAPLYPLISGAVAAIFRIGHAVAFPTSTQLGPNCSKALKSIYRWSLHSGAILPTIKISYIVWPVLLIGSIMLVRASGRGRTRWEALSCLLLCFSAPVFACFVIYFHPQDVLAMGLLLIAVALALRNRWLWAGVFIGVAFTTQQFALLVAATLLVAAPSRDRVRYLIGAALAAVVIDLPVVLVTSGRALRVVLTGSSRAGTNIRSSGGSVLWEFDLHGSLLFSISRVLPIVASLVLVWWFRRRLGDRVLEPVTLIALVGVSMILRLVFEVNLFGYYFMATSVLLVLVDVARGRIRGETMAWLGLVTLAFSPVHWGFYSNVTSRSEFLYYALEIVVLIVGVLSMLYDATKHRVHLYKVAWLVIVLISSESKIWGRTIPPIYFPSWLWQVLLVPSALALFLFILFDGDGAIKRRPTGFLRFLAKTQVRSDEPRSGVVAP